MEKIVSEIQFISLINLYMCIFTADKLTDAGKVSLFQSVQIYDQDCLHIRQKFRVISLIIAISYYCINLY